MVDITVALLYICSPFHLANLPTTMATSQPTAGPWVKQTSRTTGQSYYYNPTTRESLWHDDALPAGWAFGREPQGTRFYVELATGQRSAGRPSAAPAAPVVPATAPQLSLVASLTAGDDLGSVAYIPDSSTAGANIPERQRGKRDYLFGVSTGAGVVPQAVAWSLQCDEVSLYSITEARLAKQMTQLLLDVAGAGACIVDATACVGGNTLSFGSPGAFRHVTAVELSAQRAAMLRHNVTICGHDKHVTVLQGDFVALLAAAVRAAASSPSSSPPSPADPSAAAMTAALAAGGSIPGKRRETLLSDAADVVFFDPPWGGPEYQTVPRLDMFLGGVDVADVVTCLTFAAPQAGGASSLSSSAAVPATPPLSRFIAIKAPLNYNVDGLRDKLAACRSGASLLRVEKMHKMQLVFVKSAQRAPPLPQSHVLHSALAMPPTPAARVSPAAMAAATSGGAAASVAGVKRRAEAGTSDGSRGDAGETAAVRWASTDHVVRVSFELVLPTTAEGGRGGPAMVSSGVFLAADAATGAVSLQRLQAEPQSWTVSPAEDGTGDVLLSAQSHAIVSEPVPDSDSTASLRCALAATGALARFSVRSSTYEECGAQFITLSCSGRLLHVGRKATHESGEGSVLLLMPPADPGQGGGAAALKAWASAARLPAQEAAVTWLPCLLRPVFAEDSLDSDGVFCMPSTPQRSASPAALGLYARLGVPAGWCSAAALAKGKRSRVLRFHALPALQASASGGRDRGPPAGAAGGGAVGAVLKVQDWDERVADEVAAVDVVMMAAAVAGTDEVTSEGAVVAAEASSSALSPVSRRLDPLVRVVAHFRDARHSYTVMPDCGLSLESWSEQRRIPALIELLAAAEVGGADGATMAPERAARSLIIPLLLALHRLHTRGLLHADMHAGNVLCDAEGRVALVDYGSCRRLSSSSGSYAGPTRGGRWDSMPPEQFGPGQWGEGDVVLTPAADVFAAASTALFLLGGGVPPFRPSGHEKVRVGNTRGHPLRQPASIDEYLTRLSLPPGRGVGAFLRRALEPLPGSRFQTAAEGLAAFGLRP